MPDVPSKTCDFWLPIIFQVYCCLARVYITRTEKTSKSENGNRVICVTFCACSWRSTRFWGDVQHIHEHGTVRHPEYLQSLGHDGVLSPFIALSLILSSSCVRFKDGIGRGCTLGAQWAEQLCGTHPLCNVRNIAIMPGQVPGGVPFSAELIGSLSFPKEGGVYHFDCNWTDVGMGFVWVDGHMVGPPCIMHHVLCLNGRSRLCSQKCVPVAVGPFFTRRLSLV
jgi:hypothetical protein